MDEIFLERDPVPKTSQKGAALAPSEPKVKAPRGRKPSVPDKDDVDDSADLPELLMVGKNISKNRSYYLSQKNLVKRIAHGVYIPVDKMHDAPNIIKRYAVRLAYKHFNKAIGLCYSSGFFVGPVVDGDEPPIVFMAGDYSYRVDLGEDNYRVIFVQSQHPPHEVDKDGDFYVDKIYADPLGKFVVRVPRPELILLQNFERIKEWGAKKLNSEQLLAFTKWIVTHEYGGAIPAFSVGLADMAYKSNRLEEHDHAITELFSLGFQMKLKYLRQNA